MKIKTSSWHYRYMEYLSWQLVPQVQHPTNLCTYFWSLVFLVMFCWLFVPISAVADYLYERRWAREKKEAGLFKLWLRARKEKVCPLIEYVSDD